MVQLTDKSSLSYIPGEYDDMDIGDELTDSSCGYAAIGSGATPLKSAPAAPAVPTRMENDKVILGERRLHTSVIIRDVTFRNH